jgi:hypothetical protein
VVPEDQFLTALIEEGHKVIQERFGQAPPQTPSEEVIPLAVAQDPPGRVGRR